MTTATTTVAPSTTFTTANTTEAPVTTTEQPPTLAEVTISFDAQGGSLVSHIVGVTGEAVEAPLAPVREGYEFAGWYLSVEATEAYAFTVMPETNLTLYADWATAGLTYVLLDDEESYEVSGEELVDLELTSITLPKRNDNKPVTKIAAAGFADFAYLQEIVIPDTIEIIGDNAFYGCNDIQNIQLPARLRELGSRPFMMCASLTSISISETNQYFTVHEGVLFNKDMTTLIRYPSGLTAQAYTIGPTVTAIGAHAFTNCYFLENVEIGPNVTAIGEWTFYRSPNLDNIVIPDNVTDIGIYAFSDCYGLRTVAIGSGLSTISANMFYWCNNLQSITIPANISLIGYMAFYECHSLTSVYINRSIGAGEIFGGTFMFSNTHSTLTIYMPDSETVNHYKTVATGAWISYRSRIQIQP